MKNKFLVLCFIVALVFTACGEEHGDNSNSQYEQTESKESSVESEISEDSEVFDENKLQTIMAPAGTFYVDCEYKLNEKISGLTSLLYENEDSLIGVVARADQAYAENLQDVVNVFKKSFISAAATASRGYLHGSEFVIQSSKEVTIAGRECVQFTATVMNMDTWECYIYGYAFVIDNTPCAVIGLVSAQSQDQALIEEINTRVDEIMSTVRTTE